MRRRKVSTVLDEHLFRRTKLEALKQNKHVSEIISEALEQYLVRNGNRPAKGSVVAEGWGALKIDKRTLARLMSKEDSWLDT